MELSLIYPEDPKQALAGTRRQILAAGRSLLIVAIARSKHAWKILFAFAEIDETR